MIDVSQQLELPLGSTYFSLPLLERRGIAGVSRLPVSIRVLLESVLRDVDGRRIRDEDALTLASVRLTLRIDTPSDAAYFAAGGVLRYVLEQLLADQPSAESST